MTVKIGKSEVLTAEIGLGANKVGGHNLFVDLEDSEGETVVRTAIELGINLIDTAYIYGLGKSEELIGKIIKDYNRENLVIATKAAHRITNGTNQFDNSPKFLQSSLDASLKRLATDYIDIFYIHFPDKFTNKAEAIGFLQNQKQAGKIRAIGVSNFSFPELLAANIDGYIDVNQENYNLLHRELEVERFEYLQENQITFVPYFPLASGLLTGKYSDIPTFPTGDYRLTQTDFQKENFVKHKTKIDNLFPIAKKYQATIAQIVLAWYLKNPQIGIIIPGAKNKSQVKSNFQTTKIQLSDNDYNKIAELFKI